MKKLSPLILFAALLPLLSSFGNDSLLLMSKSPTHIEMNNRVLSNVNGKPITLYDVMKKMDLLFYRQFPQYSNSVEARFQFYNMSWKNMLKEIIEKELIMIDGKEIGINVSPGDIRQEIEKLFGPNIIHNLDKAGITYSEAEELLSEEIILKKTLGARIHSRVLRLVSPQTIKKAYEDFVQKYESHPSYVYNVVTIKGSDATKRYESALKVQEILNKTGFDKEKVDLELTYEGFQDVLPNISISKEIKLNDKEVSKELKQILDSLAIKQISSPIAQNMKKGNEEVHRLFYLVEKISDLPPPFNEMETKIREKLLGEMQEKETLVYLTKLYQNQHVNMQDVETELPENFEPFALK